MPTAQDRKSIEEALVELWSYALCFNSFFWIVMPSNDPLDF
jgi:hypothetical protein